jgi:hypothetical protein
MEDQFAGPHPMLAQLLEFLSGAGMKFASVALQEMGGATTNTPVGTTLARVEEGSKPFAAIFQRLHAAQAAEFQEILEINRETITDEWLKARFEQPMVAAADFRPGISVVPISDPRSFSQLQRTLRAELMVQVAEKAQALGVETNLSKVFREAWDAASLPYSDEVFPDAPEPVNNVNPFLENAAVAQGAPLQVNPEGDPHMLHIPTHLALLAIPNMAATPAGMGLIVHILEHAAFAATAMGREGVEMYGQVLDQMAELVEPPDTDGVRALAEAEMAKVQAKLVELQGREDLERARMEFDREKIAFEAKQEIAIATEKHRMELVEMQTEYDLKMKEMAKDIRETREKIASQERIKAAEIAAKQPVEVGREPVEGNQGRAGTD